MGCDYYVFVLLTVTMKDGTEREVLYEESAHCFGDYEVEKEQVWSDGEESSVASGNPNQEMAEELEEAVRRRTSYLPRDFFAFLKKRGFDINQIAVTPHVYAECRP